MKSFIRSHMPEEAEKLLLAASRYPEIDVPFAVEQLLARRQVREKLPSWHANEDVVYPSRLAAEQCSSEATARYKQALARGGSCCDLTGGLGVDAFYFAQRVAEVTYVERFAAYCEAAAHNFAVLGAGNIRVVQGDARELAGKVEADTFYIDPARRREGNRRVFALTDCEPDVLQLKAALLGKAKRVVVKISPMADIGETLRLLPETREVHVLAVRNECKELLFVLEGASPALPRRQGGTPALRRKPSGVTPLSFLSPLPTAPQTFSSLSGLSPACCPFSEDPFRCLSRRLCRCGSLLPFVVHSRMHMEHDHLAHNTKKLNIYTIFCASFTLSLSLSRRHGSFMPFSMKNAICSRRHSFTVTTFRKRSLCFSFVPYPQWLSKPHSPIASAPNLPYS